MYVQWDLQNNTLSNKLAGNESLYEEYLFNGFGLSPKGGPKTPEHSQESTWKNI